MKPVIGKPCIYRILYNVKHTKGIRKSKFHRGTTLSDGGSFDIELHFLLQNFN